MTQASLQVACAMLTQAFHPFYLDCLSYPFYSFFMPSIATYIWVWSIMFSSNEGFIRLLLTALDKLHRRSTGLRGLPSLPSQPRPCSLWATLASDRSTDCRLLNEGAMARLPSLWTECRWVPGLDSGHTAFKISSYNFMVVLWIRSLPPSGRSLSHGSFLFSFWPVTEAETYCPSQSVLVLLKPPHPPTSSSGTLLSTSP